LNNFIGITEKLAIKVTSRTGWKWPD